jgi:hypothetical protein
MAQIRGRPETILPYSRGMKFAALDFAHPGARRKIYADSSRYF